MSILVSIIVPVYNVERYVAASIESILSQSFKDFELIMINDGSTDSSSIICEKYVIKDSRLKLIHQVNGGFGAARNTGISHASGEYIYFMDSDDFADPDLLQDNYLLAKTLNADCLLFGHRKLYASSKTQNSVEMCPSPHLEIPTNILSLLSKGFGFAVWEQLIKREVIIKNKLTFPSFSREADIAFLLDLYKYCDNIFVNNKIYYTYNSFYSSAKFNADSLINHKELFRRLIHLAELKGHSESTANLKLKFFILWFMHVVPINYVAASINYQQKVEGLRTLLSDSDIKLWRKGLSSKKIGFFNFVSLLIYKINSVRLLYLFTILKLLIKRHMKLNFKKTFYN